MTVEGKRVRVFRWVHATPCVVRVEVDAVIPNADPSEPCLEPQTMRWLDHLQDLAEKGQIDELAKLGTVYVRRSA